jgi:exoribonuclease-2
MSHQRHWTRHDLERIACDAMRERGLEPDFPTAALQETAALAPVPQHALPGVADWRALPWCSIDNDDSLDLDQLTCSEPLAHGAVRIRVAVADVDALVPQGTATDAHARHNTTSVYTSARVFPMLPERLSTDLTSLNFQQDRLALVTTMVISADGEVTQPHVQRAWVRNQAKLAYDAVSAWIVGEGELPAAAQAVPGMDLQLRTQDATAQALRARRRAQGSLEFETFQPRVQFDGDKVVDLQQQPQNRARQLIEELMIATNTCTAHFLAAHGGASIRRVVRSPERWMRIVALAAEYGETLPSTPDNKALEGFLARRHRADPMRFPDLSLVVVKLMGSGEYVVERASAAPIGHFGLAERDYTHSTAPNRRFPDLITLRMVKAVLERRPAPYALHELEALALHCTQQEDASRKVERRMRKSEAALFLAPRIGQTFDGVITGQGQAGAWVRIFTPPAEGMLVGHLPELQVGQQVRVRLQSTNVRRGFIDFVLAQR